MNASNPPNVDAPAPAPGSAPAPGAPDPGPDQPLLHVIRDIQSGKTSAAALSAEDRRACVAYLWGQGYSVAELAAMMKVTDRTIVRDRQAVRQQNALDPSEVFTDEMITALIETADNSMTRMYKAVRDTGDGRNITPHMRMRAAIQSFRIQRDLVRTLADMRYLASGSRCLNLDNLTRPDPFREDWMEQAFERILADTRPDGDEDPTIP